MSVRGRINTSLHIIWRKLYSLFNLNGSETFLYWNIGKLVNLILLSHSTISRLLWLYRSCLIIDIDCVSLNYCYLQNMWRNMQQRKLYVNKNIKTLQVKVQWVVFLMMKYKIWNFNIRPHILFVYHVKSFTFCTIFMLCNIFFTLAYFVV